MQSTTFCQLSRTHTGYWNSATSHAFSITVPSAVAINNASAAALLPKSLSLLCRYRQLSPKSHSPCSANFRHILLRFLFLRAISSPGARPGSSLPKWENLQLSPNVQLPFESNCVQGYSPSDRFTRTVLCFVDIVAERARDYPAKVPGKK